MAFAVKVLADSKAPCGKRLTTMEWTYPRAIHSEIMTHRMLSKNSASSRAIPTEKLIQRVMDDPWIPSYIGANQKGMAPGEELRDDLRERAVQSWLDARNAAVAQAQLLLGLNVHKGVINRLLEPWMWITIIVSGTEWPNVFGLRLDKMAEPHFQHVARIAKRAMDASTPVQMPEGGWHLPLIRDEDWEEVARSSYTGPHGGIVSLKQWVFEGRAQTLDLWRQLVKISVGRCARVSYLTHDGRRDIKEDIALHDRLVVARPLHASPAEHVAQALAAPEWSGNFCGFKQYRKTLEHENIASWDDVPSVPA